MRSSLRLVVLVVSMTTCISSEAWALRTWFLGWVVEDTPQMDPVVGVDVGVYFLDTTDGSRFPEGSLLIGTTQEDGFFAVSGLPADALDLFDEVHGIVNPTATTQAEIFGFDGVVTFPNPLPTIFSALGIPQNLVDAAAAILAAATGVSIPVILSTGLTEQGRAGIIKVPLIPANPTNDAWIIVFDRTGSMNLSTSHCGPVMSRCNCANTIGLAKVGEIFTDTPGAQVAVVAFGNGTEAVVQDFTNDQNTVEAALGGSCEGLTDLADAACLAGTKIATDFPLATDNRSLFVLTDGDENDSSGVCAGPSSIAGAPPYDAGSWQNLVFNNFVGNAVVDTGFMGALGPIQAQAASRSLEGLSTIASSSGVADVDFFQELANATGGDFELFADGLIVPAVPPWAMAVGAGSLLGAALWALRRSRRRSS